MILDLYRLPSSTHCTIGRLSVDGVFECWTLEDIVRDGPKLMAETAIPAGTYPVTITRSQRFGRMLPLVCNVPDFTGIRIHAGNTDADTSGCVLVGQQRGADAIWQSRQALEALLSKLAPAVASSEPIRLVIHPAVAVGNFSTERTVA